MSVEKKSLISNRTATKKAIIATKAPATSVDLKRGGGVDLKRGGGVDLKRGGGVDLKRGGGVDLKRTMF